MRDPIDIFKDLLEEYEEIKAENRKLKQKIKELEAGWENWKKTYFRGTEIYFS